MNFISHAFHRVKTRNWPFVYIAVDIHDTIFKGTYKKNNEDKQFYPWAKEVLQNLSMNPKVKLIIYTASHVGPANDIIKWLESHDIKIFALNENPDHKGTELCDFSRKFYFDALLEDKAGFEGWHDWFKIMKELQSIGQWNVHLPDDDGVEVKVFSDIECKNLVYSSKGPSTRKRWEAHQDGRCTWDCGFCYEEGVKYLNAQREQDVPKVS